MHSFSEHALRHTIITHLNNITCASSTYSTYYQQLLHAITSRYGTCSLSEYESQHLAIELIPALPDVITYLLSMIGINMSTRCMSEFTSSAHGFTFTTSDIIMLVPRVQSMSLASYAHAKIITSNMLSSLATTTSTHASRAHATRLISLAYTHLQEALAADPGNVSITTEKIVVIALLYHVQGCDWKVRTCMLHMLLHMLHSRNYSTRPDVVGTCVTCTCVVARSAGM